MDYLKNLFPELEEFREQLKTTLMENLRKDFRYRLAVKYGLIEEKEELFAHYYSSTPNIKHG